MNKTLLKISLFTCLSIAVLVLIVSQSNRVESLKKKNAAMEAQAVNLELESQKLEHLLVKLNGEEQKRSSQPELLQLRNEVGMLRGVEDELTKLRGEKRLREQEMRDAAFKRSLTDSGPQLYTRQIRVDGDKLVRAMQMELPPTPKVANPVPSGLGDKHLTGIVTNSTASSQTMVNAYFEMHQIKIEPPKAAFFNHRSGLLLIRASLEDFNIIDPLLAGFEVEMPNGNFFGQ
jgi:hypothetical protein